MPLDRPIVVVDTETANLSGAPHLLEVGAVRVVGGEVIDSFETLVAPAIEVEPEATEIPGITNEDIRTAPRPPAPSQRCAGPAGGAVSLTWWAVRESWARMARRCR